MTEAERVAGWCDPCALPLSDCLHGDTSTAEGLDERFPALSWPDLLDGPPEPERWLIWPLVEVGRSVSLYSRPKAGKSLLMLELVAAAVAGRSTLGVAPERPVRVLYVDAENSRADLRERLHAIGVAAGELAGLTYLSFPPLEPLDTARGAQSLVELVDRHRADLVVLDTVSRYIDGPENDSHTWLQVYRLALQPMKARGVSVLRLDHSGKDSERGERGSSAKNSDVDESWELTYDARRRTRTLTQRLTRSGHGPDRIVLDVESEPLRHVLSGTAGGDPVELVVRRLDELAVPVEFGRMRAEEALRRGGAGVRSTVVAEAVRVRKLRSVPTDAPVPGAAVPDPSGNRSGNRSGAVPGSGTGEDVSAGGDLFPIAGSGLDQGPAGLTCSVVRTPDRGADGTDRRNSVPETAASEPGSDTSQWTGGES